MTNLIALPCRIWRASFLRSDLPGRVSSSVPHRIGQVAHAVEPGHQLAVVGIMPAALPLLPGSQTPAGNWFCRGPDTLQQALNRAVGRHDTAMFTPAGHARELAAATMRLAADAIADGGTALAAGVLDQAQPESPDGEAATVGGCTGLTLGLPDQWLSGHDTSARPAWPG